VYISLSKDHRELYRTVQKENKVMKKSWTSTYQPTITYCNVPYIMFQTKHLLFTLFWTKFKCQQWQPGIPGIDKVNIPWIFVYSTYCTFWLNLQDSRKFSLKRDAFIMHIKCSFHYRFVDQISSPTRLPPISVPLRCDANCPLSYCQTVPDAFAQSSTHHINHTSNLYHNNFTSLVCH